MDFGPLITQQHLNNVTNYITTGVEEGATLVVDGRGKKPAGHENGFFIGGSLFDNVTGDMVIYKEEIFGPVLGIVRAKSFEEAMKLINEHPYGMVRQSLPPMVVRRVNLRITFKPVWWVLMCRFLCRCHSTVLAAGNTLLTAR